MHQKPIAPLVMAFGAIVFAQSCKAVYTSEQPTTQEFDPSLALNSELFPLKKGAFFVMREWVDEKEIPTSTLSITAVETVGDQTQASASFEYLGQSINPGSAVIISNGGAKIISGAGQYRTASTVKYVSESKILSDPQGLSITSGERSFPYKHSPFSSPRDSVYLSQKPLVIGEKTIGSAFDGTIEEFCKQGGRGIWSPDASSTLIQVSPILQTIVPVGNISVTAGDFSNCLKITRAFTVQEDYPVGLTMASRETVINWFVPNIGIVKNISFIESTATNTRTCDPTIFSHSYNSELASYSLQGN